jgi:3-hydroxy-9,10-secoandrosta-1,3,5(10)-triene-9,17-dione monooxygenase reductase component
MTEPGPSSVDPASFRRWIARWATGVSVVTARDGDVDGGLTVNSLLSVSLAPPTLLVSLSHDADTTSLVERSKRFAVSLLASSQQALSDRFARTGPSAEKFEGVPVHRGFGGVALLDGALAWFECELERSIPVADHHLLVGRVVKLEPGPDGLPLLFYRSRYAETSGAGDVRFPPARL